MTPPQITWLETWSWDLIHSDCLLFPVLNIDARLPSLLKPLTYFLYLPEVTLPPISQRKYSHLASTQATLLPLSPKLSLLS